MVKCWSSSIARWLRSRFPWICSICGSNWAWFAAITASPSTTARRSLPSARAFAELCNGDEDLDSWLLKNLVDFQFLTAPNRLTPFWRFFKDAMGSLGWKFAALGIPCHTRLGDSGKDCRDFQDSNARQDRNRGGDAASA